MTATNSQNDGLRKSMSEHPRFSEEALGTIKKEEDKRDECEHRFEPRLEPAKQSLPRGELHDEPQHVAAGEGAIGAADAAQHCGGEDHEQHLRANVGIDCTLYDRKHDPADAG